MCRREGVAAGLGRLAALDEGAGDAETLVRDVLMLLADSLGTGLSFLARVDGETLHVERAHDVAGMGLSDGATVPLCDSY